MKEKYPGAKDECNKNSQRPEDTKTDNKEANQNFLMDNIPRIDEIEPISEEGYPVAAYSRVSSRDQLKGESIPCQKKSTQKELRKFVLP